MYTIEINGKVYTVLSLRDMLELIEEHMGMEFLRVLEEMLEDERF